ncbi:MAG: type II toxin-antitoxin system RelE/ParE family toxin [Candidatus Bathyarchaeia archaeon]
MYRVELSSRALKSLRRLPPDLGRRILEGLRILEESPVPKGALKIKGGKDVFRLRIGDYRILYTILEKEKCILVFKIEHRKRAYRQSDQ